jgi:hypothetical protein
VEESGDRVKPMAFDEDESVLGGERKPKDVTKNTPGKTEK